MPQKIKLKSEILDGSIWELINRLVELGNVHGFNSIIYTEAEEEWCPDSGGDVFELFANTYLIPKSNRKTDESS